MTLDELRAKRDAIIKDIDVVGVQWGDRSVTKVVDKRTAIAMLDQQIAKAEAAAGSPMIRQIRMYSDGKGY